MKVLMVAAELAPLAKTGGLGDAVAGLSTALSARGHDVRVLLPGYDALVAASRPLEPVSGEASSFRLLEQRAAATALRVYVFDAPDLYRGQPIYCADDRDATRFGALAAASLVLPDALDWEPDIVHCHDWHAALAPFLLGAATHRPPALRAAHSVLTLHNVAFQGSFPADAIDTARFPALERIIDRSGPGTGWVNYLKHGIRAADLVTTVSPRYAEELLTAELGMGLDDELRARHDVLLGILNGVDYAVWGPESDPYIDRRYAAGDAAAKLENRRALCEELGLELEDGAALIGLVARLTHQKGIDLLVDATPALLADTAACFALLGSGDPALEAALAEIARSAPTRVSFTDGYDDRLAHRILAGSDLILVPSRFEPCGLTQLFALRYGSIPVARKTGGLADTVRQFDPSTGDGNGIVFEAAEPGALIDAVATALRWHRDAGIWPRLVDNAMGEDFSWNESASRYERAYRSLAKGL